MRLSVKKLWDKFKKESLSRKSPLEVSLGIGVGTFIGILPIQGVKTPVVGGLAIIKKLNIIAIFLSSSVISLPPFVPFIYFFDYWVGSKIMNKPVIFTLKAFKHFHYSTLKDILSSLFLGGILNGISLGILSFLISFLILSLKKRRTLD